MTRNIAQEILMYRAKNNISQGEMARRCNVTKQTIYSVENGYQNPSKLTEAKIRMVLDERS